VNNYHYLDSTQSGSIRCHANLRPRFTDRFYGPASLEDGEPCNITAAFSDDQDHLHVDVYALSLGWHRRVTLQRQYDPDSSDFIGIFTAGPRQYAVSVIVRHGQPPELILAFRRLHLHSAANQPRLEVAE
jgi:hypothetical protein